MRIYTALLCLLLCLLIPASALGAGLVDTQRSCELTIHFSHGSDKLAGTEFRAYRVAKFERTGALKLTDEFAELSVDFVELDQADWRTLAETLSAYVITEKIDPTQTQTTDASGNAYFTDMKPGVYLVVGDSVLTKKQYFIPMPSMIAIPYVDADNQWDYVQEVNIKYEYGDRDLVDITAVKVWRDKGWKPLRPKYITVHLYGNGKKVDEVRLDKYNNWRYTWEDLDGGVIWKVAEAPVPKDYRVTIEREGEVVTIINSRPPADEDDILPQTGLDWWPVWILAALGMTLFVLGWMRSRK